MLVNESVGLNNLAVFLEFIEKTRIYPNLCHSVNRKRHDCRGGNNRQSRMFQNSIGKLERQFRFFAVCFGINFAFYFRQAGYVNERRNKEKRKKHSHRYAERGKQSEIFNRINLRGKKRNKTNRRSNRRHCNRFPHLHQHIDNCFLFRRVRIFRNKNR